ncbi:MAG: FAD-dependent oxidoreductase [Alicyclobacillaceae bacterium]|nr:FAD-dependent oxidoreductase [Alicyclobacillaceae bacterium]
MVRDTFDFVVVGGGLAGSAAAYWLSQLGDVALVAKTPPEGSNSHHAQGGLAAAVGAGDTPEVHAEDTLAAGAGLCHPEAVTRLTARAPEVVRWLLALGVRFDAGADGQPLLGLEGAHRRRRILHAGGDATGRHILAAVRQALSACPNVHRVPGRVARLSVDAAGRVTGVVVAAQARDRLASQRETDAQDTHAQEADEASDSLRAGRRRLHARFATVLATGGAGQLFARSTNPPGACGEGLALAYLAGAPLRNLEFVQFHPTALATGAGPCFLLTEALRGAGARLRDERGEPLLANHPLGDLATRDVVARSVFAALSEGRRAYLDCSGVENLPARFPSVYAHCRAIGLDPVHDPLPVTPAAHFLMGGVAAALSGETGIPGLYAIGEVAHTGCHGANRLASNSLLECLVMARELYEHWRDRLNTAGARRSLALPAEDAKDPPRELAADDSAALAAVQTLLWQHAGVVRGEQGLRQARRALGELAEVYPDSAAVCVARAIVEAAWFRRESRGAHFRADCPLPDPALAGVDTVIQPSAQGPQVSWSTETLPSPGQPLVHA